MTRTATPDAPILAASSDTGRSAYDHVTGDSTPTIAGVAEPGSTVTLMQYSPTVAVLGTALADASGDYSFTVPLQDGSYVLGVTATAPGQTQSAASGQLTIGVDTTPPLAPAAPKLAPGSDTGVSLSDGLTDDATPVIVGSYAFGTDLSPGAAPTGHPDLVAELLDTDGTVVATTQVRADGTYGLTPSTLADGAHALTVRIVDAAGNVSPPSAPLNIVVATAPATATSIASTDATLVSDVFQVHFDQPVSPVEPDDFTLVATGTAVGSIESVSGSGADYLVTVEGLSGTGTISIALKAGSVTDLAGNAVTLTRSDVFDVSNTLTPSTTLVSSSADGATGTGSDPSPSASGRLVAFTTTTAALTSGPATADGVAYVAVKDTLTGDVTLVSAGLGGTFNGASGGASMSADGSEVAFASAATNLVAGGTEAGETNVYVAKLVEGPGGLTVDSVTLVSEGDGQQGEGVNADGTQAFSAPILSADGSTVAFDSTQALVAGAESGVENVYSENVETGAVTLVSGGTGMDEYAYEQVYLPQYGEDVTELVAQPDKAAGTGGDLGSDVTSVSADGKLIAYESTATDLGGPPVTVTQDVLVPSRGYIYDAATQTSEAMTAYVDGADLIDPAATSDTAAVNTYDPVLSGDGTKVFYAVHYVVGATQEQALYQDVLATGVTTPISVPDDSDGGEVYDVDATASRDGGLVLFQDNPGLYTDQPAYQSILYDVATGTTTTLTQGLGQRLTPDSDGYVFWEEAAGDAPGAAYETSFGVTVGIDPIAGDDSFGASEVAAAIATGGFDVTGTTNAPTGSAVTLSVDFTNLLHTTFYGTVGDDGRWSAVIPALDLEGGSGDYVLHAQVMTPTGSSIDATRPFTIVTAPPPQPAAPELDPESAAANLGQGGTPLTNTDTPTIDGVAAPLSQVSLYADNAAGVPVAVAKTIADADGNYAITSTTLADGIQDLEVQAVDAHGNPSPFSSSLEIIVDTTPPAPPPAPTVLYTSFFPELIGGLATNDLGLVTSMNVLNIVGHAEPGSTVVLKDATTGELIATAPVVEDGTYAAVSDPLPDGDYDIVAYATDPAGNVGMAGPATDVTIDTHAPDAPTIGSVSGGVAADGSLSPALDISGTADPYSLISLQVDGAADTIDRTVSADEDGDFDLQTLGLPAGAHTLTVTATDFAGNVSEASAPRSVTISGAPVPPAGSPPGTPPVNGTVSDGPIAGAVVFADANANRVQDAGEAAASTNAAGQFTLFAPAGDLEATGGTDTTTGLSLPGPLFAPSGATVIDPLTTLVYAYELQTGDSEAAANAAVAQALGLLGGGATDLATLDPDAAAISGSPSLDPAVAEGAAAVADAKLADLAVDFTATESVRVSSAPSNIFTEVFTALADQIAALPSGGTLDLDSQVTVGAAFQETQALVGDGGAQGDAALDTYVAAAAQQIVAAGDMQLDADAVGEHGQGLLTAISGIEKVEQGGAATALGQIASASRLSPIEGEPDPVIALSESLVPQYTGAPLIDQASVTTALITEAPRLAAGSDQGVSDRDNVTDDLSPTFTGTALPGTFVTLLYFTDAGAQVIGNAQADAAGRYSVTSAPLSLPSYTGSQFAAVGAATDQDLAVGSIVSLPAGTQLQPQFVYIKAPEETDDLRILLATPAASAGDDAGRSALQLSVGYFVPNKYGPAMVQVFADGGTTPIASGLFTITTSPVSLVTAPLSLGPHTLTVTATLQGGAVIAGNPSFNVTVAAPAVAVGTARAIGAIVGGTVTDQLASGNTTTVPSTTGGDGTYDETVAPGISPSLPLTVTGGYDAVTGLPIGGTLGGDIEGFSQAAATLTAPNDYSAVSPLTSIVADIEDADYFGGDGIPEPGDIADDAAETLGAFGLNPDLDLSTLDPLKEAQAGDPAPLLASIKLLDAVTVLAPLIGFTFHPYADVIDDSEGLPLNLDDPTVVGAAIAGYVATGSSFLTAAQVGEVVAIVAAGNAAVDAHAAAASSLADTLSYAFAAERLEQTAVAEAVNDANMQAGDGDPDSLPGIVAAYTGTALDQAIEAERGQVTQATSLLPQGPASTGASDVTFAVSFSRPVTGLGAASFQLVSGGGLQDAAITGVSAVAGSGGESYDVTVSTGIGQGTLALTYLGGGVESGAGEPVSAGDVASPTTYLPLETPGAFTSIAIGDFNGDGRPDAVLLYNNNDISVTPYLNTGGGAFQAEPQISTDAGYDYAYSPVVADVNGDGKADILVADLDPGVAQGNAPQGYGDAITALLGDGRGGFQQPINTPISFVPTDMVAGDFNGDGKTDVALTDGSGMVHVLLGDGAGGFAQISSFAGGNASSYNFKSIAIGDFNGDGRADLAVADYSAGTVSIFLGDGDGTFTPGPVLAAGTNPVALAVGDLNRDGVADIAVADGQSDGAGTSAVTVLLGKGDGTFTAAPPITLDASSTRVTFLTSIAIGDIDDDGDPDLVLGGGNGSSSDVSVLLGNGDGTFRLGSENFNGGGTSSVALADVDGDGRTDILAPGDDANANAGLDVFLNEPETVVGSTSPSVTIDRPAVAAPALSEASGGGTFTQAGNAYTLDLGTVAAGATAAFSLANAAAAPADSFDGTFSAPSGTGFAVAGASLPQALAAGQSYAGLSFGVSAAAPGAYSETITFAPRDATAVAATVTPPDPDGGAVAPAAAAATDPVAAELPAITLTVTADVSAGAASPAILAPVPAVSLPDARVGGADGEPLTITNDAAAPAADLDVAAAAAGDATVGGGVAGLAPQASDAHSLVVGLDTSAAGLRSGTVTLSPSSEPDTALPDQDVAVSGSVFREAAASIAPVAVTVHVGDPGSVALPVANADPADGFSEALVATLAGAAAGLSVASAGPTADVAAGATDASSLAVGFSTAAAGTITGSADVALSSDGGSGAGGVDGLGQVALASATVPVAVTVDNYAHPGFTAAGGTLTAGVAPGTYVLNLGTTTLGGAALSADLSVLNDVQGPADLLGGSFTAAAGPFVNDGFASFGGLGAGAAADAGSVSLAAAQAGTFSETVDLAPTDAEGAGSPVSALPAITLTVTADVMPCFHAGTRIATPGGPAAVETLRVGDLVSTASGGARPVVWVGRRRVDCTRHPRPELVHPVRVAAGAFGRRLPSRDLILSPDHAVFAEGVLIPIKRLVNGASVAVEPRASVDYLHIELDRHDVVLAEGLPAESYLDAGDRDRFAGGARVALHPDFSTRVWEAEGCAPLRIVGPEVDRVRDALVRRAKRARAKARTQAGEPRLKSRLSDPHR